MNMVEEFNVNIIKKRVLADKIELPKRCHTICINKIARKLCETVSFYGASFNVGMILCYTYEGNNEYYIN